MKRFHQFLMKLGRISGCHQLPERSFFIGGWQFPVCARCTGIVLGYILGAILRIWYSVPWNVCIYMAMVMFVDWYVQYLKILPSTNRRRFLTGCLCGMGYLHFLWNLLQVLFEKIIMRG